MRPIVFANRVVGRHAPNLRQEIVNATLDAARRAALESLAGRLGLSMSDVLRLAVKLYAEETEPGKKAVRAAAAGRVVAGPPAAEPRPAAGERTLTNVRMDEGEAATLRAVCAGLGRTQREVFSYAIDHLDAREPGAGG